jgi:hypothetical protein
MESFLEKAFSREEISLLNFIFFALGEGCNSKEFENESIGSIGTICCKKKKKCKIKIFQ